MLLDAQVDSLFSNVELAFDYRFRIEQDWNSTNASGGMRDDRTRLRYRLRFGAMYDKDEYSFGMRIRTGDPNKQQDPQLTIGKGLKEFGTLPIGFEKVFFQYEKNGGLFWLGKNTYPFTKNNESFWSDNVFPEGLSIQKNIAFQKGLIGQIKLTAGHFILASNDGSFIEDAYFQGFQSVFVHSKEILSLFPSVYLLRNIPNIPDGSHTFLLDYSIAHLGGKLTLSKAKGLYVDFDIYQNLENYSDQADIDPQFQDQGTGYTIGLAFGNVAEKNNWFFKASYAYLEQYAILDYMAQNDWARWDYSAFNSPDGRLSNYQGMELVAAYALSNKAKLVCKYYLVEQLIPYGTRLETGQRIRFDLDVKI